MKVIQNSKLHKINIYTGFLKTVLTIIVGVVTVPFALNYFGDEKYGVWNVINSFMIILSMSNLGMNSASSILINKNPNSIEKLKIFKKSLIVLLIITPIILLALILFDYSYPDWIKFTNSPDSFKYEAKKVAVILILFFFLNLPFSIVTSALNGFQRNHIENIFSIIGTLLNLFLLLIVIYFKRNLLLYSYLLGFGNLFLNILKSLYLKRLFGKYLSDTHSQSYIYNPDTTYRIILITGYRCMLGALAAIFVNNTDNIVIAHYLGVHYVTEYAVTYKLYTTVFSILYIFNSSIVPLIGKNFKDPDYLSSIYSKTFFSVTILGGLLWVGTLALGNVFINLWTGPNGYAGVNVLFFLGAYSYIFSVVNLNYVIINTFNYLKGVAFITLLEGLLNLIISIFLIEKFGLVGVAAGTFLGTFLSPFLIFPIILKRRSSNLIYQNNRFILIHFLITIVPSIIIAYLINITLNDLLLTSLITLLLCIFYLILSYFSLPVKYRIEFKEYSFQYFKIK